MTGILWKYTGELDEEGRVLTLSTEGPCPAEPGRLVVAPLALFVWGEKRILPVRVTDFSITEEAFDPALNPIRAKVSLGLRVLSMDDLGFDHKGGSLFMAYLQSREQLAKKAATFGFDALGIGGIP